MRSPRRFTLIEILMTVALTALVFAMIGGILLSVLKATENIEEKMRTEKAGYGILATLRRDLSGVYAYDLGDLAFKGVDSTEGSGGADTLHFVTTADVAPDSETGARARLVEIGYRLQKTEGAEGMLSLFRRAAPFEGDPLEGSESYEELFTRVKSFNLEYLDPESKEWKEGWSEKKKLPLAVKVILELALDETQRIAAQQNQVEIPPPRYEMVVGVPSRAQIPEAKASEGEGEEAPPK